MFHEGIGSSCCGVCRPRIEALSLSKLANVVGSWQQLHLHNSWRNRICKWKHVARYCTRLGTVRPWQYHPQQFRFYPGRFKPSAWLCTNVGTHLTRAIPDHRFNYRSLPLHLKVDPVRFPGGNAGMRQLTDEMRAMGFKWGHYTVGERSARRLNHSRLRPEILRATALGTTTTDLSPLFTQESGTTACNGARGSSEGYSSAGLGLTAMQSHISPAQKYQDAAWRNLIFAQPRSQV